MLKRGIFLTGALVALFGLLISVPALAQTSDEESDTEEVVVEATEVVEEVAVETEEVIEVDEILTEDIVETDDGEVVVVDDKLEGEEEEEITEAPSGFSLFWRNLRERVSMGLTFDPVKKAEKQVRYAEHRRQIFEKLMENAETDEERARAARHLEKSQEYMEKVEARRERWAESNKQEVLERLKNNIAKSQVRRENLFDRLEEKLPVDRLERLQELREKALEKGQAILQRAENSDKLSPEEKSRLLRVRALTQQKKDNLEDLKKRRRALQDELAGADDATRKERMEALYRERREKIQDNKEKTKALLERRRTLTNELKTQAASGDEQAEARLKRVRKVNQEIKENAQERRENVQEKKEVLENIKDRKEDLRERAAEGSEQAADKLKKLNKVQKKVIQTPPAQVKPVKDGVKPKVKQKVKSGANQ